MTTFFYELHRSWRLLPTVSAALWALCSSPRRAIRSVWASIAAQTASRDVSYALDDFRDALREPWIEGRRTAKVLLRATRYTLRWLPSSLLQRLIDGDPFSTSPVGPASPVNSSLGKPEYFESFGPMAHSSGWTEKDLRALQIQWEQSYPQRYLLGGPSKSPDESPIDSREWLEAITTWPNPIFETPSPTTLTVQETGAEPWATETWDAAKVSEAEGWNRNPIGYTIIDPELYELAKNIKIPPPYSPYWYYPPEDVIQFQFPKPAPPARSVALLANLLNELREAGILHEDQETPQGVEEDRQGTRQHQGRVRVP